MAGDQEQRTSEQAGSSIDAIRQQQTTLAARHAASAEADRALAEALASAHSAALDSIRRLDAIAADIDGAVRNQAALALDTAMGAREFQRFLIAKHQEILAVVAQARALDSTTTAGLDKLRDHYSAPTA